MGTGISYSNPFWWARINSWSKDGWTDQIELGKGQSGGDIITYGWDKRIDTGGRLNLQLVPHKTINYVKAIKPNSPVEFWISNGSGREPVMFTAWVDRVSQSKGLDENGAVQRRINVACRDATKLLGKQATFYNPQYNKNTEDTVRFAAFRSAVSFITSANPDMRNRSLFSPVEYFWLFFTAYMKVTEAFLWLPTPRSNSVATKFASILDINSFVAPLKDFPYLKANAADRALGTARNLWELMQHYSHNMLNELFIDTRSIDDAPKESTRSLDASNARTLPWSQQEPESYWSSEKWATRVIFRPRPYLLKDMVNLPRHVLASTETEAEDIGFSDNEVKNYFRVTPVPVGQAIDTTLGQGKNVADIAMLNAESMTRFGLSRFETTSDFCFSEDVNLVSTVVISPSLFVPMKLNVYDLGKRANRKLFIPTLRKQTEILAVQQCRNEELASGTVTCSMVRPEFHVGDVIEYRTKHEAIAFYLEGVGHNGTAGQRSRTNLTLVRGVPLAELEAARNRVDYIEAEIDERKLRWVTPRTAGLTPSGYRPKSR